MFKPKEDLIVRRIKDFIKSKKYLGSPLIYIMLRNGYILFTGDYFNSKINPQDAYVYFELEWASSRVDFYYPFLRRDAVLLNAYLSKLGFHYKYFVVPATGLKYIAFAAVASDYVGFYRNYLTIEVFNLDTVVDNTNLSKVVFEVLDGKLISGERRLTDEEYEKISRMFRSQRLFVGHNFEEAWDIIKDYYDKGNKSLAKEAAHIAMDYDRIFQPYTVCYDMDSWKEIDCWSIK